MHSGTVSDRPHATFLVNDQARISFLAVPDSGALATESGAPEGQNPQIDPLLQPGRSLLDALPSASHTEFLYWLQSPSTEIEFSADGSFWNKVWNKQDAATLAIFRKQLLSGGVEPVYLLQLRLHSTSGKDHRSRSSALEKISARLTLLMEATPSGILGIDHQRRVCFCNRAALRIFKPRGDLLGLTLGDLFVEDEAEEPGRPLLEQLFESQPPETAAFITRTLSGEGTVPISVGIAKTPPQLIHEQAAYLLTVSDATEHVAREKSLKVAQEQADAANRAKTEFLANMSHEIRTPLSAIISFSELMLSSRADSTTLERATAIKRNAFSLLELLNDILDLSKLEAERLEITHSPLSIVSLMSDLRTTLAVRAQEKDIELSDRVIGSVPEIFFSDRVKLRQVLVNLLNNAIKFTHEGGVVIEVAYEAPDVRFSVIDSGIGLDEDSIAQLFEPFSQGDRSVSVQYGGSGLGLSICKRLVDKLGGRMTVASEPGAGSEFNIWVPGGDLSDIRFIDSVTRAQTDIATRDASALVQLDCRVLLVDDREDVLQSLAQLVEQTGAVVATAKDGVDAIDVIEKADETFDIVALDLDMPRMDGYETLRVLRERDFRNPIIALTAHAGSSARDAVLEWGFDDYLTKPIDIELFCNALHRALNGKGDTSAPSVLVIDDHIDSASALAQLLRVHDCTVQTAANGSEARHALESFQPDFCLVDIGLPDIDGVTLVQELAAKPDLAHTQFIATTGDVGNNAQSRYLAAGFQHFLPKPVDLEQVKDIILLTGNS